MPALGDAPVISLVATRRGIKMVRMVSGGSSPGLLLPLSKQPM
jgi:hypothetical protein